MTSADFSWQALLHDGECSIAFAMSMRPPRVLTRSFPLIPAPSTVSVPCSYWTLVCLVTSSTASQPIRATFTGQCFASGFLQTPPHDDALALGCTLPTAGRVRDFHPLERVPAGHTKNPAAAGFPAAAESQCRSFICRCYFFFFCTTSVLQAFR